MEYKCNYQPFTGMLYRFKSLRSDAIKLIMARGLYPTMQIEEGKKRYYYSVRNGMMYGLSKEQFTTNG